jgi:hypothetical protein
MAHSSAAASNGAAFSQLAAYLIGAQQNGSRPPFGAIHFASLPGDEMEQPDRFLIAEDVEEKLFVADGGVGETLEMVTAGAPRLQDSRGHSVDSFVY